MARHKVYLCYAPECIRGWLAYKDLSCVGWSGPDVVVSVEAETGAKAKNKAITAANNGFEGVEILRDLRKESEEI